MDRIAEIKVRLEQALSPSHVEIIDESHLHSGHAGATSGAGHFNITIVSDKFTSQSAIQRHRMVYLAVNDLMPSEIHALSIQAQAPDDMTSEEP